MVIALLKELVPQNLTYELNEDGNEVFSDKCLVCFLMDEDGNQWHGCCVENSMKDATHERRRGPKSIVKVYKVDDNTKIESMKQFLASSVTKDSQTLYLSQVLIEHANAHIITATHQAVLSNFQEILSPGVSSQEDADTLMIQHRTELAKDGSVFSF